MYARIHETDSGFFAGALSDCPQFSCDPHHPAIRKWYCASTPWPVVLAAANLYSLLQYLVLARSCSVKNRPLSARRGTRLCMLVDMGFRESTFHEGGYMK